MDSMYIRWFLGAPPTGRACAVGLLLSCLGSPWGFAASGAPGSPGAKLPQGELGSPRYTYPRHTKGVRFLAHPRYPLGIPTSVPEVSPGAPRFFSVVIKRESGYITKTSHPCISGRGWILKILRTPPGDVEYPYINQELLSRGAVYPSSSPPPT